MVACIRVRLYVCMHVDMRLGWYEGVVIGGYCGRGSCGGCGRGGRGCGSCSCMCSDISSDRIILICVVVLFEHI